MCRYMSVTKGWWLRWNSPIARRSGAFVIEVVERAPQVCYVCLSILYPVTYIYHFYAFKYRIN